MIKFKMNTTKFCMNKTTNVVPTQYYA